MSNPQLLYLPAYSQPFVKLKALLRKAAAQSIEIRGAHRKSDPPVPAWAGRSARAIAKAQARSRGEQGA